MQSAFIKVIKLLIYFIFLTRWSIQSCNKKKTSNRGLSEEQKYHKNGQEQSKLTDSYTKQKKTPDNNNIDTREDDDTSKPVNKRRKRYVVNY